MAKKETKTEEEPKFIISELYGGKVKIKFYPLSHQYWVSVNGSPFKRKTGVTTIIGIKDKSKPLSSWQQQMTADFLLKKIEEGAEINVDLALEAVIQNDIAVDEAIDIGKEMHDWIERYIKGKLKIKGYEKIPDMPTISEAVTGVNGFLSWEKEHKVKYISSERVVYSMKYDYIGTLDLEAIVDDIYCLNDFKSSNGLYNSVRMQTIAYARSDEEERKKKVYKGRWALRFSKYTEKEYMRRENRKKEIKEAICRIKGTEYKDYPIPPYQAFEAKFMDKNKGMMEDDFDAFLNCKSLNDWNNRTDWFYNPEY